MYVPDIQRVSVSSECDANWQGWDGAKILWIHCSFSSLILYYSLFVIQSSFHILCSTHSHCTGMILYQWLDFQPVVQNWNWLSPIALKVGNTLTWFSWPIYAIRTTKKLCEVNIRILKCCRYWSNLVPEPLWNGRRLFGLFNFHYRRPWCPSKWVAWRSETLFL